MRTRTAFSVPAPPRPGCGAAGRIATVPPIELDPTSAWLSREELDSARERLPILYVDAVPVRVDDKGAATHIGLLLRVTDDGRIHRELVSGRVLYHERVRDALMRNIEKDLGPMALPRIPVSPQPFTVAEYFPTPGVTPFHDPRQHAVSLAYIVPVAGDCAPQQSALDLAWLTVAEASDPAVLADLDRGHGILLRQALAHLGYPV
ncbi:MAG: NUDIX hydrolase family protein [Phycicoccus sp.]|nr:NUDIX hydrolase family protein [Phycicoccus sp.]